MTVKLGGCQSALYRCETVLNRQSRIFATKAEAQVWVNALVDEEWFDERWPDFTHCQVELRHGNAKWSFASREQGAVYLASLSQAAVLHELAHLLCSESEGHGRIFAETLLTLVRHCMGFMAWADFYNSLRTTPEFSHVREGLEIEDRGTVYLPHQYDEDKVCF